MIRIFLFAALLWPLTPAGAQEPSPAPSPDSEKAQPARVRAWIFPGEGKVAAVVSLRAATAAEPFELAASVDGGRITSPVYNEIPAGSASVEVRSGDKVVASENLTLRERGHYTMLVWRTGDTWQTKSFADPPAPKNAADRPLRILNFASGRSMSLGSEGSKEVQVAGNSVQEVKLPAKLNGLEVRVLAPDGGPPAQTGTEVDFSELPLAYLVVGPDHRGRMRPRLIAGGPEKVEVLEPVEAPKIPTDPRELAKLEKERLAQGRQLERDSLAAQIAILEAHLKKGSNPSQNADDLMRDLRKKMSELRGDAKAGTGGSSPRPNPTASPAPPQR